MGPPVEEGGDAFIVARKEGCGWRGCFGGNVVWPNRGATKAGEE